MYVQSASTFTCKPIETIDVLKEDLKKYTNYVFRRINKFILLSLIGVHQCVYGKLLDAEIAVYLATENGNLGDTENVLFQIYQKNLFPKPFNFINTMSNTASFYVAQSLNTLGRSITVSSKNVSFERGLELVRTDFMMNNIKEALVGGVDEAVYSRERFCQNYDAIYHQADLVEGSCWLYLTAEQNNARGEIRDIKTFSEIQHAIEWIHEAAEDPVMLSFGILMDSSLKEQWKNKYPGAEEFEYIHKCGYYDTAAACAVSSFFKDYSAQSMVHINRNIHGQYVLILCRSY